MVEIKRRLRIFIVLFICVTLFGTFGFMLLEKQSFLNALYYNIVTMSTVGYGDIHPTHPATRLLAMFIIVLGGGTFIGVIANASEMMLLKREMEQRLKKQNIVLGIFFSEMGYRLLQFFSSCDIDREELADMMDIDVGWSEKELLAMAKAFKRTGLKIDMPKVDLTGLNQFLHKQHAFMLRLLENPVLVEHEGFTELLLAVAHMGEELNSRKSLTALPSSDLKHLAGDFNRGYHLLVEEWLAYLVHLKKNYPYLYSLAARKNPFNPEASTVVDDS